jgi:hypothetical protein
LVADGQAEQSTVWKSKNVWQYNYFNASFERLFQPYLPTNRSQARSTNIIIIPRIDMTLEIIEAGSMVYSDLPS